MAFKVKTTNPMKYCVRPNTGIVLPRSTCDVIVTMQAQKEMHADMQCKDKFLLQSAKAPDGATVKVKTMNPKKYCVRSNTGIVLPRSTCDVIVTMQAQKEMPANMQCKDKFLLQSAKAPSGATVKDITAEMFNKESGNVIEESKLRVIYVSPPQPPSPVPEESEEESLPRGSVSENGNANSLEAAFKKWLS